MHDLPLSACVVAVNVSAHSVVWFGRMSACCRSLRCGGNAGINDNSLLHYPDSKVSLADSKDFSWQYCFKCEPLCAPLAMPSDAGGYAKVCIDLRQQRYEKILKFVLHLCEIFPIFLFKLFAVSCNRTIKVAVLLKAAAISASFVRQWPFFPTDFHVMFSARIAQQGRLVFFGMVVVQSAFFHHAARPCVSVVVAAPHRFQMQLCETSFEQ